MHFGPSGPSAAYFGHMSHDFSGPQVSELITLISSRLAGVCVCAALIDWTHCLKLASACFSQSGTIWSRDQCFFFSFCDWGPLISFYLFSSAAAQVSVWAANILDDSASSQNMKTIDRPVFLLIATAVINFRRCCCGQLLPVTAPPQSPQQEGLSKPDAASCRLESHLRCGGPLRWKLTPQQLVSNVSRCTHPLSFRLPISNNNEAIIVLSPHTPFWHFFLAKMFLISHTSPDCSPWFNILPP